MKCSSFNITKNKLNNKVQQIHFIIKNSIKLTLILRVKGISVEKFVKFQ